MAILRIGLIPILFATIALAVGGCSETRMLIQAAKDVRKKDLEEKDASEKPAKGAYKIGKPYQIQGVWYYPRIDPKYDETGIASWYGHPFHGRRTANGDVYDMNELTAAHKTLPMPTSVRVTNLGNGRSLVLRVNDRGPFTNGRIIDVSRRAAQLLGFQSRGTAKVRVTAVSAASGPGRKLETSKEERYALPAVPRGQVTAKALPPPPGAKAAKPAKKARQSKSGGARVASAEPREPAQKRGEEPVEIRNTKPGVLFVQAGTFARYTNANRLHSCNLLFCWFNVLK